MREVELTDQAPDFEAFGQAVWEAMHAQPLGSLPKRELELLLLRAALEGGFAEQNAAAVARVFRLTPTRADGYLTDLALRSPPYTDRRAILRLGQELREVEATVESGFISLPARDAGLRLWVERKAAERGLHPGERVNRSLIKLSVPGLFSLLDGADQLLTPKEAWQGLRNRHRGEQWIEDLVKSAGQATGWRDVYEHGAAILENSSRVGRILDIIAAQI